MQQEIDVTAKASLFTSDSIVISQGGARSAMLLSPETASESTTCVLRFPIDDPRKFGILFSDISPSDQAISYLFAIEGCACSFVQYLVQSFWRRTNNSLIRGCCRYDPMVTENKKKLMVLCHAVAWVCMAELWWPVGYGKQPLYQLDICATDRGSGHEEHCSRFIGLRKASLHLRNSEGDDRFYISVNGTPIVVKGYAMNDHTNTCTLCSRWKPCLSEHFAELSVARLLRIRYIHISK